MHTTLVTLVSYIHKDLTPYTPIQNTRVTMYTTISKELVKQPTQGLKRILLTLQQKETSNVKRSSATSRRNKNWQERNVNSSCKPTSRIKNTFSGKSLKIKINAADSVMRMLNTKNRISVLRKLATSSKSYSSKNMTRSGPFSTTSTPRWPTEKSRARKIPALRSRQIGRTCIGSSRCKTPRTKHKEKRLWMKSKHQTLP